MSKASRAAAKLAHVVANADRADAKRAAAINDQIAAVRVKASMPADDAVVALSPPLGPTRRAPRRAMLIVNTKSGPHHDSIMRVAEIVELLAACGIAADVRVKLHKSVARRDARAAAKAGYDLVIAAGGDGTVAAVARGVMNTGATLGIIALGTYNNIATCLGIPTDLAEACTLIANGAGRRIDVGQVTAHGCKKPRVFLEMGAVGLAAPLAPVGQYVEKGRWQRLQQPLPAAIAMQPTEVTVRLDRSHDVRQAHSLLVEVANSPRTAAGLLLAPDARMDDGLLDVAIYADLEQAALAARFVEIKAGGQPEDNRIRRATAQRVDVETAVPLPVLADSKVIGTTPARFEVLAGALAVVVGHGFGLLHPASAALVQASAALAGPAATRAAQALNGDAASETEPAADGGALVAVASAVTRVVGAAASAAGGHSNAA